MKIVAIMPIKLENERLPGKNIKLLAGKPLLHYQLEELLKVQRINERYVYCSDENIKNYLLPGIQFIKGIKN